MIETILFAAAIFFGGYAAGHIFPFTSLVTKFSKGGK